MYILFLGDSRANEHHTLTVMHTLWMREHNRLAESLGNQHPNWTDEKLFNEARRIVIAEYQHIIYKEWLPNILGVDYMKKYKLDPKLAGYTSDYRDGYYDPRLANEFAGAAFRFGHSLIPSTFKNSKSRQVINNMTWDEERDLKDTFNNPKPIETDIGKDVVFWT